MNIAHKREWGNNTSAYFSEELVQAALNLPKGSLQLYTRLLEAKMKQTFLMMHVHANTFKDLIQQEVLVALNLYT